jgi:hypothetical protein
MKMILKLKINLIQNVIISWDYPFNAMFMGTEMASKIGVTIQTHPLSNFSAHWRDSKSTILDTVLYIVPQD